VIPGETTKAAAREIDRRGEGFSRKRRRFRGGGCDGSIGIKRRGDFGRRKDMRGLEAGFGRRCSSGGARRWLGDRN
jgi:hypothetical protein